MTGRTGNRGESRMTGGWTGRKMNHRQTDGPSSRGARSASPCLSCPRRRALPWKTLRRAREAGLAFATRSERVRRVRGPRAGVTHAEHRGTGPGTARGGGREAARPPAVRRPRHGPGRLPGRPPRQRPGQRPSAGRGGVPDTRGPPSEEPPTCLADAPADPVISAWRCPERRPASRRPAHTRLGS